MATVAVIYDHRPDYLVSVGWEESLLCLPLGTSTVLGEFVKQALACGADQIVVTPTFDVDKAYENRIAAAGARGIQVWSLSRQHEFIQSCEGEDIILTFDARYRLVDMPVLSDVIDTCRRQRLPVHVLSRVHGNGNSGERLLMDSSGGVKQVRRLYEKVAWSAGCRTIVVCSSVPQPFAETIPVYPIDELRARALNQGIPGQDYAAEGDAFDLFNLSDLLELSHVTVSRESRAIPPRPDYFQAGRQILLAAGSLVSPSARIIGPVIVKPDASIGAGATIIGPCVVGRGVRIQESALVARAILPDGSRVRRGATVVETVGSDGHRAADEECEALSTSDPAVKRPFGRLHVAPDSDGRALPALQAPGPYPYVKRLIDIVGAVIGIVLLLPFLPFIAFFVKIGSPGPVFFTHRREGQGGREFPCLKFRTMKRDAHKEQRALYTQNEVDGPQFKLADDPRTTRIGRWLRKLNVDELPQLVNVLLGQMSLVGPRPSPFRENQICLAWREARLSVRPGVTGLWQICRDRRSDSDFNQWIYYDIKYVRYMSLWLDMKILLYTVLSLGGWKRVPMSRLIPLPAHKQYHSAETAQVAMA